MWEIRYKRRTDTPLFRIPRACLKSRLKDGKLRLVGTKPPRASLDSTTTTRMHASPFLMIPQLDFQFV
jgi:hypothetical protein